MGLFGRDSEAKRYLSTAPAGQRKDLLAAACINQIARLPVAASSEWGEPVTDVYGLQPAAQVVRGVLRQDQSMYAWVARTTMVFLDATLMNGEGGWLDTLGVALSSVGFEPGPSLRPDLKARLSDAVRERVDGLCGYSMNIFWAVSQQQFDDGDRDRRLYRHMFEDPDPRTAETAHDITAWAAVILGRLRNCDLVAGNRFYTDEYLNPPAMDVPGWYPNPYNYGAVVRGEPEFQRAWNGRDWTDRIRFRVHGSWDEDSKAMRSVPDN
ncbi:hypothetical protein AB0K00_48555 [Dactylosporangium sp. NPDC049525]|uniref:hypothetical protein n=1 Tax=Dactylosporangium sp. NPDC049525 TaxID=3154730 RepID=UPI0034361837